MYESDLTAFWGSFGVPAYDENTVPDEHETPTFPYITFSVAVGDFNNSAAMTASVYDKSMSWEKAQRIAYLIASKLDNGGVILPCGLWLKKGSPFMQRMNDGNKDIRRIVINVTGEFLKAR